jgi:hypothetical protein
LEHQEAAQLLRQSTRIHSKEQEIIESVSREITKSAKVNLVQEMLAGKEEDTLHTKTHSQKIGKWYFLGDATPTTN